MNDAHAPMRRVALLLLLVATPLSAQLSVAGRPPLSPLDVAVEDAADVWSRGDGTGYANDIVRAAFRAGGIEPRFHVVPYARCKAMVIQALVPACLSMSRDATIPASVVFADSANFTFHSDFYQNVRRPLRVATAALLPRGSLVGVVRGYEYPDAIHRLERLGIIRLVVAGNEVTNLRKLADGRLDAALVNTDATKRASDLLERSGVRGRITFAFDGGSLPAYVGFSMRHPRGKHALARYTGRRAIAANGTLAIIERNWTDSIRAVQRRGPSRAGNAR
ncbi:ABC transporter substrate-binding protein [soil metagenome]